MWLNDKEFISLYNINFFWDDNDMKPASMKEGVGIVFLFAHHPLKREIMYLIRLKLSMGKGSIDSNKPEHITITCAIRA